MKAIGIVFRSPVDYAAATALQEQLVTARLADHAPDCVLFLEHRPVITLGVSAKTGHVLLGPAALASRGIGMTTTSRGGDVTYHAPGQLVVYPILRLAGSKTDVHAYVAGLEELAIQTAAAYGVSAYRRRGLTGAWTDVGKLAAIGVRFRRGVCFHGMSFNVNVDLAGFETIVPCGLHGLPVTSLKALLGTACPPLADVRTRLAGLFGEIMQRELTVFAAADPNLPEPFAGLVAREKE